MFCCHLSVFGNLLRRTLIFANSVDPQYDSKPLFLKWSAQRAANYENTYSTRIRLFKVRITLPGVNVNLKKFFRALQRVFVNFSH